MRLIPTARKERLPKGFSYPVGAEAISAALGDVRQLDNASIWFVWRDDYWASQWRQKLKTLGKVRLLEVTHSLLSGERELRVYSVPSDYSVVARDLLLAELAGVRRKLLAAASPSDTRRIVVSLDLSEAVGQLTSRASQRREVVLRRAGDPWPGVVAIGVKLTRHSTREHKRNTMKKTIQMVRLVLAALLLAATSSTVQAAPRDTGIQGRAALYISYGTPVEVEPGVWISVGDVTLQVATSFTVLSAHSGREVGRFSTDADGAFSISLPPGKYVVVPDILTIGAFPFAQSVSTGSFEVRVSAKEFTYAPILYYHDGPFSIVSGTDD